MAADLLQIPKEAKHVLGGKGKKLRTHELTLRRLEKGRILATHRLADKDGNPPTDGQRSMKEYALDSKDLGAHVEEHMGDEPEEEDNPQEESEEGE